MKHENLKSNLLHDFSQIISCDNTGRVLYSDDTLFEVEIGQSLFNLGPFFESEWMTFQDTEDAHLNYPSINLRIKEEEYILDISYSGEADFVNVVLLDLTKQYKGLQGLLQEKNEAQIAKNVLAEKNKILELEKEIANVKNHQLKEIQQYKDHFLAHMSHELRTPLNALLGFVQVLSETELNDKQKDYTRIINSSGNHLLTVVNDILDLTKMQEGKLKLNIASFSLNEFVKDIEESLDPLFKERGNEFITSIEDSVPEFIEGDQVRAKQVLFNLLSNANKFTDKGTVNLSIELGNETLIFKVKDNGIGMRKEDIEKAFGEFSQVYDPSVKNYGGTGLGLKIVKSILELKKGTITVESELGKGTEFIVEVPLNSAEKASIQIEQEDFSLPENLKILAVDDAHLNRLLIKEMFIKDNCVFEFAENGLEAIDLLKEQKIDLVLMDIQMPIMDGYEAMKIIRNDENESLRNIPIITMTAHVISEELDKIKRFGANDILLKPFKKRELTKKVSLLMKSQDKENFIRPNFVELNGIDEIAAGDSDIRKELLITFRDQTKQILSDFQNAMTNSDYETVQKLLHKLSNSFRLLNIPYKKRLDFISSLSPDALRSETEALNLIKDTTHKALEEILNILD